MMVVLGPGSAVGQTKGFEEEDAALLWESGPCEEVAELYLKEYPKGLRAKEARECLAEPRAAEIVLPDGLTLADWALMAEDRLKDGDHARLLEEAGAHLREYGPVESVEAVRKQAVSGLIAEVRVMVREDARGALDRIALIEAAAGERPELLLLKAHAHGQLGDHAAEEAAYLQWLRSVPQTHPERRDVLSALARARAAHEKTRRFSELLGRPFSHEWKEDSAGWTDLHYAALLDLPEAVTALVEAGMDVDTRLKDGSPPFGDDLKRTLAALGFEEFEDWTADGETPLMIAAVGNARDAAAELIAQGADVSAKEDNGGTALHYAARNNSLDVAKLLIERGADVSAKGSTGWTALHYAARDNSLDVAKLLIERGADVSAKSDGGWTPLHYAARDNSLDVAKLLIERGADVSAKSDGGWTALHYAARDNSLDVAKLLIERGADVSAKSDGGWTPLHYAARDNSLDVAKLLIERGADVSAKSDGGGTALHYAAWKNSLDVAKLLIERGADVSAKEDNGGTALHYAARNNSLDVAKLLIERGADVSAKEDNGGTALHYAAWKNSLDVAKLLIERGADVSAKSDGGWTPLHYAARDNSLDVAKLLIERGADVSAEDSGGETPLDKATERNHGEMQALLRRHGGQREAERRMPGYKFRDCPECPELVVVPGGEFGHPFAVGVYEVTFGEWEACVSGGRCGGYRPDDRGWGRGNRPVVNVSWDDAQGYVEWLSDKTGKEYRLPSRAEWEYVARAGTETAYWWGDDIGHNRTNCDSDCGDSYSYTAPVGSFPANPFGLHDMHGNVDEWVEDCHGEDCGWHPLCGGAWTNKESLRSACAGVLWPTGRFDNHGFRVARTLTLEAAEIEKERAKTPRFSELLGRPVSHEWKEDSVGWTDLHYAALLDLPGAVAALCDAGMAADTRLKDGPLPFDDDLKRTLAALGHEEEFKDWQAYGETPLMIAAVGNARDAAADLVACGADVNAKGSTGWTALHFAARKNSLDVAKLLIERGADVSAREEEHGWTPLHIAAWKNSLDVAKLLIERGADVSAKEDDDWTALHVTAWDNSLDVAKLLIERGADVSAKAADDWTALHFVAWNNSLDVAKLLIERSADVNAKAQRGARPLHFVAWNNSLDVAKLLIERSADVNAKGSTGLTALHYAARKNSLDVAKLLIERGADVSAKDDDGDTPLDLALSERDREEMQAVLHRHGGRCAKRC